jgi:hypothetical protein
VDDIGSLSLAVVDFVPSVAFLIGAVCLVRLTRLECGWLCASVIVAGSGLVFLGGFLKAVWKLLYTAHLADIQLLSEQQFVLLAPGFLLMLIGVVWFARSASTKPLPLLAMAPWKIPLLGVMVLCSPGTYGVLAYVCFRRHSGLAAAGLIIAFLSVLVMGGMASGEQTLMMQWIEESSNSIGQIGFAVGCCQLYRVSAARLRAAR